MSGIKRSAEDKDPDYEEISVVHQRKRQKAIENSARDATILKIESIIKEQFSTEMKSKENEIEIIDQRLNEARRMMDKLRACIVANYYASAALNKSQEGSSPCDTTVLNHPSIKKFMESPSRASSPANQRSETPSVANSETDSMSTHEYLDKDSSLDVKSAEGNKGAVQPEVNDGKENKDQKNARCEDGPRRFVKKIIVVGNVSKYIPPDKREENDQSTHKWMVYVRGSRKEPSIDHFVKKVWFFLHPSYKPNDLVEVSEPPFHLTRRGWGEFPVRVQIHFKDSQNKRIDIIHNLKLDRTYTGLQTLGAETVVEVEILRHSLGEDLLCSQSFNESHQSDTSIPSHVKSSHKATKELSETAGPTAVAESTFHPPPSSLERTPTKVAQRLSFGISGSTAFHPITASCKIVPQGQAASLAESPGKSFQPITMSCKIVSGSPTSKQSGSTQVATGTRSPVSKLHGSSFTAQNIKQEDSLFAAMPPLCPIGSHPKAQSPKPVTGGLGAFTKVIIKQEPSDASQQQPEAPSTSQTPLQQIVTVKGSHMIAVSPQKALTTSEGSKVVGIPVGSAVQAAIKPSVTISGGQILVAKPGSGVAKALGSKQIVAQGVAKAVLSSGIGNVTAQSSQNVPKTQVTSAQKAGTQGSVMATLQLPTSNIPNLANLPPGTKLYLTTNSKNPSGKGKLLLIPQGAILRAANTANLQSGSASSGSGSSTTSGLPQHLTYTSYILKQTPQGTFLVGQPSQQSSGKQTNPNVSVQGNVATSAQGQQTLKLTTGQKGTLVTQAHTTSTAVAKVTDGTAHTQKPGTTLLRVSGGVITASSSSIPVVSAKATAQQAGDGSSTSTAHVSISNKPSLQQQVMARIAHVKSISTVKPGSSPAQTSSTRTTPSPAHCSTVLAVKMEPDGSANTSTNSALVNNTSVKTEENEDTDASSVKVINQVECGGFRKRSSWTENLQNFKQLLTAIVKKVPLTAEKCEDGHVFCANSIEQYYSWNIGKRRASEWQRAVTMKKMLQEIVEKQPKFNNATSLKTKQIVHWCRIHGYTPPDPESSGSDKESIEDVLTRIDNESTLPTSYSAAEILCRRMEELEKVLKKEIESDEEVDVLSLNGDEQQSIQKESEATEDMKYLVTNPACEFVKDTAQEIGVSIQPVEVQKNIFASAVEEMILKATEQFVSDILRDSLAVAYQITGNNRTPREITVSNIHQAICTNPLLDFLTNKHMGSLNVEDDQSLK